MSTPAQILAILQTLYLAYPDKKPEPRTDQLYLQHLADIPIWILETAARQHIQTSPWFPRISNLRQIAARLAGTKDFRQADPAPFDSLAAEALALEDAFYHSGRLDPAEWESLALRFEATDRPHRARRTRQRLTILQKMSHPDPGSSRRGNPPSNPVIASQAPAWRGDLPNPVETP